MCDETLASVAADLPMTSSSADWSSTTTTDLTARSRASRLRMFGVAMALNHTCEKEAGGDEDLSGSSPDEKAFVAAAHDILGIRFICHDQSRNATLIEIDGVTLFCEVLEKAH